MLAVFADDVHRPSLSFVAWAERSRTVETCAEGFPAGLTSFAVAVTP